MTQANKALRVTVLSAIVLWASATSADPIREVIWDVSPDIYSGDITDRDGNYLSTENFRDVTAGFRLSTNPLDWDMPVLDTSDFQTFGLDYASFNLTLSLPALGTAFVSDIHFIETYSGSVPDEIFLFYQYSFYASGDFEFDAYLSSTFLYSGTLYTSEYSPPFPFTIPWQQQYQESIAGHVEVPPYQSVPEPGTLALLGIGLFGMGLARRRKKAWAKI